MARWMAPSPCLAAPDVWQGTTVPRELRQAIRLNDGGAVPRESRGFVFFANKGNVAHKWLHYLPIYDQVIGPYAGSKVRTLEIGVNTGGSLDIWRKLLGPDAVIFEIDIDTKCASLTGQSGEVRIGSQDDPTFLQSVVREMGGSILSWTMVPILPRTSEPALTRCSPPF
jgi:hypothetical protein